MMLLRSGAILMQPLLQTTKSLGKLVTVKVAEVSGREDDSQLGQQFVSFHGDTLL